MKFAVAAMVYNTVPKYDEVKFDPSSGLATFLFKGNKVFELPNRPDYHWSFPQDLVLTTIEANDSAEAVKKFIDAYVYQTIKVTAKEIDDITSLRKELEEKNKELEDMEHRFREVEDQLEELQEQ